MRSGRVVKEGEQPLKTVKVRATTISKKRAIGMVGEISTGAIDGDPDGVTQGMYSFGQTEIYRPPPVVNVCSPYHACTAILTYMLIG